MWFDSLVVGHTLESNPVQAVRGSKYSGKKDKTSVLDREEARDGSLSEACKKASHADTRTTQLYDRRADAASVDKYGKVGI